MVKSFWGVFRTPCLGPEHQKPQSTQISCNVRKCVRERHKMPRNSRWEQSWVVEAEVLVQNALALARLDHTAGQEAKGRYLIPQKIRQLLEKSAKKR